MSITAKGGPAVSKSNAPKIIAGAPAMLAHRYANALFELAESQKKLDVVAADVRALKIIIDESPEFRLTLRHPLLKRAQLEKAVQSVAEIAKLAPLTANFLTFLAQNRRLSFLDAMLDAFLAALAAQRKEITVDVRTARALSPEQAKDLAAKLAPLANGGEIHLDVTEDKSLLGGLVVQIGSCRVDASVKGKLARLEHRLTSSVA